MNARSRCSILWNRAFTWIELLVVIAVLAALGVLFSPVLINDHSKVRRIVCANNLTQIGLAFRLFASDHADQYPSQLARGGSGVRAVTNVEILWRILPGVSNSLSTPGILVCPADTRRRAADFQTLTTNNISYFIGLNFSEAFPQTPLAGDRNLTTNGVPVGGGFANLTTNLTLGWTRALHDRRGNVVLNDGSVQAPRPAWHLDVPTHSWIFVP